MHLLGVLLMLLMSGDRGAVQPAANPDPKFPAASVLSISQCRHDSD